MAADNTTLAANIAKMGGQIVPASFANDTRAWFKMNQSTIMSLCQQDKRKAAMFVSSAFTAINRIPQLLDCQPATLWNCILTSMALDLYVGPMNECAYVPFRNNKKDITEAVFIPMYQGFVKLIYRGAFCHSITGHAVHEADHFKYKRGSREHIEHEPAAGSLKDRGAPIGVYTIITNRFGGEHINYLTREQVMGFKARSKAAGSKDSPWNSPHWNDERWMWLKTSLKQNGKMFPKNSQISRAFEIDEKADRSEPDTGAAMLADDVQSVADLLEIPADAVNSKATDKAVEVDHAAAALTGIEGA